MVGRFLCDYFEAGDGKNMSSNIRGLMLHILHLVSYRAEILFFRSLSYDYTIQFIGYDSIETG